MYETMHKVVEASAYFVLFFKYVYGCHETHGHIHTLPAAQERRSCCKGMDITHGFDDIHEITQ
jgi:hypothetical protein